MDISILQSHLPQRMFLLQGGDSDFEILLESAKHIYPMVHALAVPRFTVEHAEDIARFAVEGDGTERLMLVYFSVFSTGGTAEILLKSLEEPAPQTTIVLMTPHPYTVPQTIRSRVLVFSREAEPGSEAAADIIAQMRTEAENKDDDAAARRAVAITLLDKLEIAVRDNKTSAQTIYKAKAMLYKANLPTKFVLDYVVTMVK